MADLTEAQKAEVYFFCGQAQRFVQVNTAIEQAIAKINSFPAQQALLTNPLSASPVGLLAKVRRHYDVTIPAAYVRLQAGKVGSVELRGGGELKDLRNEGRAMVKAIKTILGVMDVPGEDVFSTSFGSSASGGSDSPSLLHSGGTPSNWVGG